MENTEPEIKTPPTDGKEEKSFFGIIVHSFFIIPFLIAVFAVLLFTAVNLLTRERQTAYDYLEDVKVGGLTKRWQAAFELSKILANPRMVPLEERFREELAQAFRKSKGDDPKVRQYLALAMARTGHRNFAEPLIQALNDETDENRYAIIYALGMLRDRNAAPALLPYLDAPEARIRSVAVVALGNIQDERSKAALQKMLHDAESNVQWGAAISLAQMNDPSGKTVLANLLDRPYLAKFPEVDPQEQTQLMLAAIRAVGQIRDPELNARLKKISTSDQNMKVRAAAMEVLGR